MEAGGGRRGGGLPVQLVRGAIYLLLVAWLAWPLPAHLGSNLPHTAFSSDFDTLYTTWVLCWETHTLTTEPARILVPRVVPGPTPPPERTAPRRYGCGSAMSAHTLLPSGLTSRCDHSWW